MTKPATIKCPRCKVDVPVKRAEPPYVPCTDHRCPLNTAEENEKLKEAWERSIG